MGDRLERQVCGADHGTPVDYDKDLDLKAVGSHLRELGKYDKISFHQQSQWLPQGEQRGQEQWENIVAQVKVSWARGN